MKVLWTVNNLVPEVADVFSLPRGHAISWIDALGKKLKTRNDIELSIACVYNVKSIRKQKVDNILYYILPQNKDNETGWSEIIYDFCPDIIHAFGTEHKHNLFVLRTCSRIPVILSLQGILTEYAKHYYAGIDIKTMLRYSSIKDLFLPTGFFSGKMDFIKRAKIEQKIIKLSKYAEGRSTWDMVSVKKINSSINYYYCPRMIRPAFFNYIWDYSKIQKHTILVHQGGYPIKGLHFVLEAIHLLKKHYPDIQLYVAGGDIFAKQTWKQKIYRKGYVNYLKDLIERYDLHNNIIFTGFLTSDEMAKLLSVMNVSLMPSAIENAPNSLAEAMIVGTPIVASFVGGNMDMIEHNKEGFLYCYNESNMLAYYIKKIFEDENIAIKFSKNAMRTARDRHDPIKLEKHIVGIYNSIICDLKS
jgi:glycosyltransferase involved in cell wall biosynthesis